VKDLSVIIPSRNGRRILEQFLPAILEETLRSRGEVIVVDDCSEDDTQTWLKSQFPEIKLIARKTDPGFCHAVNLGMSEATGRYLMLLNNDIIPQQ